tara:strand:- start:124 stop:408 length:285 start_codon:yes stop_codon:yes gene_type:complete
MKKIVIETPTADNKTKHNLIKTIRELLNIYTKLSIQNIGFNCGLNKNKLSDMCYYINIIDSTAEDYKTLLSELNSYKDITQHKETEEIIYFKLT